MKHTIENNTVEAAGNGIAITNEEHRRVLVPVWGREGIEQIYALPPDLVEGFKQGVKDLNSDVSRSSWQQVEDDERFAEKWKEHEVCLFAPDDASNDLEKLIVYLPKPKP